MKRMIAVLVLLSVVAGCGKVEREIIIPGSPPADDAAIYLAGFTDGYIGIRPGDSCVADGKGHSFRTLYDTGLMDGYITGRRDAMQSE